LAEFEDVNAKIKGGTTPFLLACTWGLFDLALQMVQKGADVRAVDKHGLTPLGCVARAGPGFGEKEASARARLKFVVPLARALIERGAPVDGTDKEGITPLMWAVNSGNLPLVQLLIDAGAQVNAQDRRKGHRFTVFNYAQRLDVVKVLPANGADPSKRNGYGMDASEYAQLNDHLAQSQRIADLLRSHLTKPDSGKPSAK
jgi:ankyrin repeat protein